MASRKFSEYFGFTQGEVAAMLQFFGISYKMDMIRQWYDGYIFGNSEVFCPWDVVSYLSAVLYDEEEEPQNFWANTSSNAILDEFVNHEKMNAKDQRM